MPRFALALLAAAFAAPAFAQLPPDKALASMKAGDGLQVELFAHEPMVLNPTSIDVDHLGRVWVAEAVNYRRKNFNRPILREAGDRIQVLIDEKGEGKATKAVTFYQGKDLYGPLSVCVIPTGKGLRVLVAQSPDILEFTCRDATNPVADGPPKKFLTGFGGFDHDHGVHGLHLGPDGKLYFTVGDQGLKGLQSSDGKGRKWTSNRTDCQAGTVWRCDLDGKNVELIAHNFRNNYEACVDSFGEIWLSDNDDDGNQQTRICFVMPGGNYGYFPRGAGQSHWHEEQPGIVHKTLRTGFGSPCGIQFYEGNLLPKQYHNTLMHADAGPREVRAFTRKPKGAGYELDKALMLTSTDNWFRPSDVCTAPDGSVFVCDWYDPGVGGHGMGDWTRGRIYRLTPKDHKGYKVPDVKLDTDDGITQALASPNNCVRFAANEKLNGMNGKEALPIVAAAISGSDTLQARCFRQTFLIMRRSDRGIITPEIQQSLGAWQAKLFKSRDFMAMLVRCSWEYGLNQEPPTVKEASKEYMIPSTRELLLALRDASATRAKPIVEDMMKLYDGSDIFYRAALNIACGTDPVRRDAILADFEKHFPEWNDKVADLVWELRPKSMLPKMEKLLADAKLTGAQKARIVDILAASDDASAGKSMLSLLKGDAPAEVKAKALDNLKLFLPTKWNALVKSGEVDGLITDLLAAETTRAAALDLIGGIGHAKSVAAVAKIATDDKQPRDAQFAAYATLGKLNSPASVAALKKALDTAPTKLHTNRIVAAFSGLLGRGQSQVSKDALDVLSGIVLAKGADADIRRTAYQGLAGSRSGTQWLLAIKERGGLPEELTAPVGRLLRNSPFQGERNKAMVLFPAPGKLDPKKLPPIAELVKRVGNPINGKLLMAKSLTGESQCMKCHMVRGMGGSIGPDISMIGKKGSKENLYDSLLTPSKAIADQYATWKLDSDDGQSITGLLVGETETTLTVRDANGKDYQFPVKGTDRKKQLTSLMPDNLIATFTEDDLVDVVEYLMTLKTPTLTPDSWHIAGPFGSAGDADLDKDFGPEKGAVDLSAKYDNVSWKTVRPANTGYVDLAVLHGPKAVNSLSYLYRVIESPVDQEATILLGTDDGCRLVVNGAKVFGHERHEAAAPERDSVKVKLKKGPNAILLKVNNGNIPHGFYFTMTSGEELKLAK